MKDYDRQKIYINSKQLKKRIEFERYIKGFEKYNFRINEKSIILNDYMCSIVYSM